MLKAMLLNQGATVSSIERKAKKLVRLFSWIEVTLGFIGVRFDQGQLLLN